MSDLPRAGDIAENALAKRGRVGLQPLRAISSTKPSWPRTLKTLEIRRGALMEMLPRYQQDQYLQKSAVAANRGKRSGTDRLAGLSKIPPMRKHSLY
jgi:hypothetical protein